MDMDLARSTRRISAEALRTDLCMEEARIAEGGCSKAKTLALV